MRITLVMRGRIGGVAPRQADHRELGQRDGRQRLAGGAQELRQHQLVHRRVGRHVDIDEAAHREQDQAARHQQARIDALHQERHERQQEELRDAAPHHHLADLLGVVALDLREIGRDEIDRAEGGGAEHRHQDARAADRRVA